MSHSSHLRRRVPSNNVADVIAQRAFDEVMQIKGTEKCQELNMHIPRIIHIAR